MMTHLFRRAASAVLSLGLVALIAPGASATPATMTVSGSLGDSATTGVYTLRVALYEDEFGGAAFWQDVESTVVIGGLFDLVIGDDLANPLAPSDLIDAAQVWLGVSVVDGPTVAGQEPEFPRTMLTSVGYAFAAHKAAIVTSADHAETVSSATTADRATSATSATYATTATSATSATSADHATHATSATDAVTAQFATHATTAQMADSATSATTADHAETATSATTATSAGLATSVATADQAAHADLADLADHATSAQSADTAGHAANVSTASTATNVQSAVSATTATNATRAASATTAGTAQTAVSATHADYAVHAGSVATASSAQTATTAERVNVATRATTAASAQNAATADSAAALSCVACISLAHLSFDPATQAELEAKIGTISVPTTVDGLAGGTIAGNVTVIGSVSADALLQAGNVVCDASGNCGATLGSITCADGANTPKWDPDAGDDGAWTCASDAVDSASSATLADKALDLACPGCVDESELDFDVTTQSELAAAVQSITVPTTVNGMAGGEVDGTVTVSGQVAATAFTQDGNALCDASGNCGQTLAGLNCPAGATKARYDHDNGLWVCVQNRVAVADTAASAQTAASVASVSCVGCVGADELAVDPATQDEMDASVAALNATLGNLQVPTTVDGFGGGTLTTPLAVNGGLQAGDSTVETALATVVQQDGQVICDTSGNCGQTLGSLGCRTNQTIRYNASAGEWECSDVGGGGSVDPGPECAGFDEVKHWTGSAWECRSINAVGENGEGRANGFRAVDSWGYAWDGIQRAARYWHEAKADCESEGGRLPTATELWRNSYNYWAGGRQHVSGDLGRPYDTSWLWTLNPHYDADDYILIKLSDGNRSNADGPTNRYPYRCTWPNNHDVDGFAGNKCFGPAGEECRSYDRIWNVDRADRAPIPAISAYWECNFYNASIVTTNEASDLIKEGWLGASSDLWRWSGNHLYVYNNAYRHARYRWYYDQEPWWGWDYNGGWGSEGDTANDDSWSYFRCIGKRDAAIGHLPPAPQCAQGDCFEVTKRKSRLIFDNRDRAPVEYQHAAEACRLIGASLPTTQELQEAIQAGLENGSNQWITTSSVTYWYNGGYGHHLMKWTDTGTPRWRFVNGNVAHGQVWDDRHYRCVWHETLEQEMTTCDAGEVQIWDGETDAYTCEPAVDGSSGGQANAGTEYKDAWGNVWDGVPRGNLPYEDAKAECEAMGARLPLISELWRVRGNQDLVPTSLATSSSTVYVWSLTPSYHQTYNMTMRPSDGDTTHHHWTNSQLPFYCVWPATEGDRFSGHHCYGDPDAPCFDAPVSRIRVDKNDRPRAYYPSAHFDCRFQGGRLWNGDDINLVTHAGLPNGSPSSSDKRWHWVAEPEYYHNNGYHGYLMTWWEGTADATWEFRQDYNTSIAWESDRLYFRCVFTDQLD